MQDVCGPVLLHPVLCYRSLFLCCYNCAYPPLTSPHLPSQAVAAHVCYTVAGVPPSFLDSPECKYCLLGADHTQHPRCAAGGSGMAWMGGQAVTSLRLGWAGHQAETVSFAVLAACSLPPPLYCTGYYLT